MTYASFNPELDPEIAGGQFSLRRVGTFAGAEITGLEIPTGQPIVYDLDENLAARERYYLSER